VDKFHDVLEERREEIQEQVDEINAMMGMPVPERKETRTGAAGRFAQHAGSGLASPDVKIPTPAAVKAQLDEYVLGQEDLKMTLAVSVVNHYERVKQRESGKVKAGDAELGKANILIVGPTGTGKTHAVETVARQLDVPFAKWDATTLTSAGYVGDHPEDIIQALLEAAGGDVSRAEKGIVFIDEIDKKMRKTGGINDLDVGGSGAQQSLLKLLEGSTIEVSVPIPGMPPMFRRPVKINTKDILFVTGGAFTALKEVMFERFKRERSGPTLGFGAEMRGKQLTVDDMDISQATEKDLAEAGMLPELIGRLQIRTHTNALTVDDLKRIMTEPKDAVLKQFQTLFRNKETGSVELEFEDDALEEIARRAQVSGTGARALRHILEDVLKRAMFEVPSRPDVGKVVVTKESVTTGVSPLYIPRTIVRPATAPPPGATIN
jgi:ATP-dependent Clp protease ATP-binding subunit ClpX